jgi:4-hydroxybenzoate polyprenyltransferase
VVGCSLVSLAILLTLNLMAVLLGVGSLALVAAYPFMKRITWWPQAWLGLTFNWGALMGFAAATGPLPFALWLLAKGMVASGQWYAYGAQAAVNGAIEPTALLLYLGGVFWTLGYDTLYALQDIEDDAMIGVKSSARRLGARVRQGVTLFYAVAVLLAGLAGLAAGLGPLFWAGLTLYALHMVRQIRRIDPADGAGALRLFKSNREAGFVLLLAIIAGSLVWPL